MITTKGDTMRLRLLGAIAGFFLGLVLARCAHGDVIIGDTVLRRTSTPDSQRPTVSMPPPSPHIVSLDYTRAITESKDGKLFAVQIEAAVETYKRQIENLLAKLKNVDTDKDEQLKRDRLIEDANRDLDQLKTSKLKVLNAKVAKKLQEFSEANAYYLVLNRATAVLYSTKTHDVTDDFIKYLDK